MPESVGSSTNAVADKNAAETFGESDVNVTLGKAIVKNESVELGEIAGTSVSESPDQSPSTADYAQGVIFNPNTQLASVDVTAMADVDGATRATLKHVSTGEVIDTVNQSISGGETVTLSAVMDPSTDYAVYFDAEGADWTFNRTVNPTYPYTSEDGDVTESWFLGRNGTDTLAAIQQVQFNPAAMSESMTVGWPMPTDLYSWDVGVYQASQDGGTVAVYVEEETDSGWTEIAGPIKRGDSIPADPANNVRYRVELSRDDAATNPTLDAIYRRFKL